MRTRKSRIMGLLLTLVMLLTMALSAVYGDEVLLTETDPLMTDDDRPAEELLDQETPDSALESMEHDAQEGLLRQNAEDASEQDPEVEQSFIPGDQILPEAEPATAPELNAVQASIPEKEPESITVQDQASEPETESEKTSEPSSEPETEIEPESETKPEASDPYGIDGYNEAALSGLDFSSGRLIVGTYDPSIFVDDSVVISELNGLYLLQFSDVETARKAYAYYSLYADLVLIDGKVMAVNEDTFVGDDFMTEDANPFAQAQEAIYETGNGYYDVAIIDTGVNGYADTAVSVIGETPWDDNGHGSLMASLVKEQDPGARILSIKAFEGNGTADLSAVYAAFQYAITQSVRIILISAASICGNGSSLLREAIYEAMASGTIVVASAGNNGRDAGWFLPAGMEGVVTIGACDETGERLSSSNYGPSVNYNVVAGSTSEAAARFTGWLSANGLEAVWSALGNGMIYPANGTPEENSEEEEIETVFRNLLETNPSADRLEEFLSNLNAAEVQRLYVSLTREEMDKITNLFFQFYAEEHEAEDALTMTSEHMRELFCQDIFVLTSVSGSDVTIHDDYSGGIVYPYGWNNFGDYPLSDGDWIVAIPYYVTTSSGTFRAFCAEASSGYPGGTVPLEARTNDLLTKLYLISPNGPLYSQYKTQIFDTTLRDLKENCFAEGVEDEYRDYCLAHVMISGVYCGDWAEAVWTTAHLAALKQAASQVDSLISNTNAWFLKARSYIAHQGHNGYEDLQDVFWVELPEVGAVTFGKTVLNGDSSLTVSKTLTSTEGADQDFTFTLTVNGLAGAGYAFSGSKSGSTNSSGQFSLRGGQSVTIAGLPAGASYFVTEADVKTTAGNSRFKTTVINHAGTELQGRSVGGTIGAAATGQAFTFTVTGLPSGSFPYTTSDGGSGSISNQGTIQLAAGQTATIQEIPDGTSITVTETVPTDLNGTWTCNQSNHQLRGTVTADQTASLGTFINTYTPKAHTVKFNNDVQVGYACVKKVSQAGDWCPDNALYSLEGAVYEIYSDSALKTKVATLTTGADGITGQAELLTGTYYVIETRPSRGHAIDPAAKAPSYLTVQISGSHTASSPVVIRSTEPVQYTPTVVTIDKDGGDYPYRFPLAGVLFELAYYDNLEGHASGNPLRTWILETREGSDGVYLAELGKAYLADGSDPLYLIDGKAVMPLGTYTLKEKSTVPGYTLSRGFLWAQEDPDKKVDTETGNLTFVVREQNGTVAASAGNHMAVYNRPVKLDTEALGSTAGNDVNETHYMDASVNFGVISDTVWFDNLTKNAQYHITGRLYDVTEDGKQLYGMVQDRFTAGSRDDESHVMYFPVFGLKKLVGHTLAIGETLEEVTGSETVRVAEETDLAQARQAIHVIAIDTELTDQSSGDHVAGYGEVSLTDRVDYQGLLPGDTFTLKGELIDRQTQEVVAMAQKTFTSEKPDGSEYLEFAFTAVENHTYTAMEKLYYEEHLITSHQDLQDEAQSVHVPKIRTSLGDSRDGRHDAQALDEILLTDTVRYQNLIPGEEYTVYGILMNKNTSEPALDDVGQEICASTAFTPETEDGETEVVFSFSGKHLAGESVVAFETLEHKGIEVAVHADLSDEEQMVRIPDITTTLADPIDDGHDALASSEIRLSDEVQYRNLIPGEVYLLKGVLMDQETGSFALDDQGEEIRSETVFIPSDSDGASIVTFRFSGKHLEGHSVVAFEELYVQEKQLAVHAEIDAEPQTLYFPRVRTTLSDMIDEDKDALANHESESPKEIRLKDMVSYEKLFPGENYVLEGVLMDRETGKPALDQNGKQIQGEISFVPAQESGSEEVVFHFHGSNLAGHTLVAVEELYHNGKLVAIHSDLDSFDQSAWLPRIETKLYTVPDGEKEIMASEDIILEDEVTYHNLFPGRECRVYGRLIDKDNGRAVLDDQEELITAQATFTPQQTDGSIRLTFRFSGISCAGKSLVAFEELYRANKKVAVHADIQSADQTVHIPSVKTSLGDFVDGQQDACGEEKMVLADRVTLRGLIPGHAYTLQGQLMDKETGAPAKDDQGKEIRQELTFTSETECCEKDVVFAFQGQNLKGHSLVAFEDLLGGGKSLAVHHDLEDRDQTVWIPEIRTTLKNVTEEGREDFQKGWIRLEDEIHYRNLIPGKQYRVTGVLYQKNTGKPAADDAGDTITSQMEFIPETANGSVTVTFRFRGSSLEEQRLVAFEQLYAGDKKLAVHEDLQDEDQSVMLPKIPQPQSHPHRLAGEGIPRTSDIQGLPVWLAVTAGSAILVVLAAGRLRHQSRRRMRKKY